METSLLPKSPWSLDQVHPFMTLNSISQDFTMSSLCCDDNTRSKRWDDSSIHSTATSTQSSTSSECDEELLSLTEDFGVHSYESELFNDLGGWLSGPLIQDQICGSDDCSDPSIEVSELSSDGNCSLSSPLSTPSRQIRQSIDVLSSNLMWSNMSEDLQLRTIEALSEIISTQMDLREQLEIIQIIDSKAVVSPTDTEFAIDLDCLSDEKLEKFRAYIKKSLANKTAGTSESHHTSCNSHKIEAQPLLSNTFNRSKIVKKEHAKEKKSEVKAAKQRRKKEYRQLLKEKKSGLFVREEVLALSSCPTNDEEDIDIDIDICEERF